MTEREYIAKINSLERELAIEKEIVKEAIKMLDVFSAQIESLEKKVSVLEKRLAAAEKQNIKLTSSNSNIPPSKDSNKKKRPNNRKKSNKKPGGQLGHKGHVLELSDNPDKITCCLPQSTCPACGKTLNIEDKTIVKVKQEIDIPPVEAFIEQFEQAQIICSCGHICIGKFPDRLKAKVQYGGKLKSMISYLSVFQYLPFERMKDLLLTCFGIKISKGTIFNSLKRSAKLYKKVYRLVKDFLQNSDMIGADETHIKINGDKAYFWVWQNSKATFIACENSRKQENIDKHFPNGFPYAVIISDRYAAQLNTPAKDHQICWVHLLRHLKLLKEKEDNPWIHRLRKLFNKAIKLNKEKSCWNRNNKKTKKLEHDFDKLLASKVNKAKFEKTETLRNSLIKNRQALLSFLYYEGLPYHNNDSERAIRNAKVKMNISFQFKSGGQDYAIIRSVIDTLIKNDMPIFDSLFLLEHGKDIQLPFAA